MYNPFKNKINTFFFNSFIKDSTKVYEIENKEEIYYQDNKLAVVVKDEEVGLRIYDIVKNLKDDAIKICTPNTTFEISKYISDKEDRIQIFYVDFTFNEYWKTPTLTEKLQELIKFIENMQTNGYFIDTSKFKKEECNCISSLLSFFVKEEQIVPFPNEFFVEFIHFVLSDGEELNTFYEEITSRGMCCFDDLPYCLPVTKMCYEYFVTGSYLGDIYMVLQDESLEESFGRHFYNYLMFNKNNFEKVSKLIKTDSEYAIYSDNVKIYNNMPQDFERFIKDNVAKDNSVEQVDGIVIDLNEKIIGYKFYTNDIQISSTLMDKKFTEQIDVLSFISILNKYLAKIEALKVDLNVDKKCTDFSIEESVIYHKNKYGLDSFVITEINELFKLISSDEEYLKTQIVSVFFKLYLKYLKENYGAMLNEEEYFDKVEVRYLAPILAREFVNYALGRNTDYIVAGREFFKFLYSAKNTNNTSVGVKNHLYDSKFEYNPIEISATFDYEVEKKYGIKMKKLLISDIEKTLPDGRRLVGFSRKKDVSEIKSQQESNYSAIYDNFPNFEDDNVKIVGISEIIYSKTINANGKYEVKGYITTPLQGQLLTDKFLLSLSNKDFLKLAGYLFTKFSDEKYIPCEYIYMDDKFNFYVDIFKEDFSVETLWPRSNIIDKIVNQLRGHSNCNPYMFVDIAEGSEYSKGHLLRKANSLDEYCNKHSIYYNSLNEMCPICLKTMHPVSNTDFNENQIIFEDQHAKHYKLDKSEYFIKVYNSSNVDMNVLENHVDSLITQNSYQTAAIQEAFIPVKKAVDKDKNFVGYLYKPVEFKSTDICMNFTDLQNMNNLMRLKCLIRLVTQVNSITQSGFKFINNPFDNVFFIRGLKKQVQIVNIDFMSTKGSLEKTKKWTSEYVYKILGLDDSIEMDLSRKTTNLETLLHMMCNLADQMTKYCYTHKMYYKNEYLFCPKCVDKNKIPKIDIIEKSKSDFEGITSMTEGGEAHIYSSGNLSVIKVFKEDKLDINFKNRILVKLLEKKATLEKIDEANHKFRYIVPNAIFVDDVSKDIYGYRMDKVEGTPICNLRDKEEIKKLGFSKKDVLEIMITVGEGIEALHNEANMYIGDLNGRNILFDSEKNVYFLDFDGMGIDEIAPEFCTDEYIDPISKKNKKITMKDDWYSLAVQVFHYLTYTHPFNGIYSVRENGNSVMLGITDKMERRISLLGNHGIKAPAIAEDWSWMDKEFKNALLEIFEKESRVSIVPYLKKQYEILYGTNYSCPVVENVVNETSTRINSKFVANLINPFNTEVVRIINPYAAICTDGRDVFVSISGKYKSWERVQLPVCTEIYDILLSDSEDLAFVIYSKQILVYNLQNKSEIYRTTLRDTLHVVVNDNTLYYVDFDKDGGSIFKREFSNSVIQKEKIRTSSLHYLLEFYVESNSKFITIDYAHLVYCNDEFLYQFNNYSNYSAFKILYDDISKLWLIMSNNGDGIIINSKTGNYEKFDLRDDIDTWNVNTVAFNKGDIYIPSQDSLYIVSTKNNFATKKMECHGIMTPNSIVYDIKNTGFNVMNNEDNALYEVSRG